jgi:hypothetical protein
VAVYVAILVITTPYVSSLWSDLGSVSVTRACPKTR